MMKMRRMETADVDDGWKRRMLTTDGNGGFKRRMETALYVVRIRHFYPPSTSVVNIRRKHPQFPSAVPSHSNQSGQAVVELAVLLPLMFLLAGAFFFISYYCWQGIKLQQAANLGARIQGQERVSGGQSTAQINAANGTQGIGGNFVPGPTSNSVYDHVTAGVTDILGGVTTNARHSVMAPEVGMVTDKVTITMQLFGGANQTTQKGFLRIPGIDMTATAYGGEDPHMYALPRWAPVQGSAKPYWQVLIERSNATNPGGAGTGTGTGNGNANLGIRGYTGS